MMSRKQPLKADEKRKQSQKELEKHLVEQLQFLEASSISYDRGFEAEAKRIAVTIRVLLHDTKKSHSLLGQLGLKSKLFWDLSLNMQLEPGQMAVMWPPSRLVGVGLGTSFLPHLDSVVGKRIPFDKWWTEAIYTEYIASEDGKAIQVGSKCETYSRFNLVDKVANQDGGAHVDPGIDEWYAKLSRDYLACGTGIENGVTRPLTGIELASIRQISHEVLRTFKYNTPKFLVKKGDYSEAKSVLLEEISIGEKLGHLEVIADRYNKLAYIYLVQGELDIAKATLNKAIYLISHCNNDQLAHLYINMSKVLFAHRDLDGAKEMCLKAASIYEGLGHTEKAKHCYERLSRFPL